MNNLFNQNENLTNSLNQIQKNLYNEIEKNKNFKNEINHREDIIKNLTNQLTEYTLFKNSYEDSEKELVKVKTELNEINIKNNINIHKINESENELNNLTIILNRKINQIIEWIECNFGTNYNYDIKDIPQFNDIKYNINLNLLIDLLCKKNKQIQETIFNLDNINKDNENKINDFINKIDLLHQDNIELNKNLKNEKEKNYSNKKEIEDCKSEIEKLRKKKYLIFKMNMKIY
jgi:hypothetical protein